MIDSKAIFADIGLELKKARAKFPSNMHNMKALTEEVGELAKALLQINMERDKGVSDQEVYEEAIQVAAMAIRVASEGDGTLGRYNPLRGYWGDEYEKIMKDGGP